MARRQWTIILKAPEAEDAWIDWIDDRFAWIRDNTRKALLPHWCNATGRRSRDFRSRTHWKFSFRCQDEATLFKLFWG